MAGLARTNDSFAPELTVPMQARRVRAQAEGPRTAAAYEAGSFTRRTVGWRAPTASANQAILANLTTLRDRSRAATRNDGHAKSIIDQLTNNIVGTGITPLSQAADPALRKRIDALWLRWTDESDADGRTDFYGQQKQAVRAWLEGGEAFVRLRPRLPGDGLSVPLQVQVLEPELCPHAHTVWGERIRAGIQFTATGQRSGYWFHPSRPEQDDYDASQLRRVPAHSVVHLYEALRPGQLRGLPHLTQSLISFYELDKYDDATLLRQQLSNLYVGFVTRPTSIDAPDTVHPLTGEVLDTAPDGAPMLSLEPGIFQELGPGEDVKFSDPPEARGYEAFMRQQLFGASAGTDVPYELATGDFSRVNDRTVRVILNGFRRIVQAYQHQVVVFLLCRAVWNAWMERVFLSGALPIPLEYLTDPEPWRKVKWNGQGWSYIHPVQDVQAIKEAIRCGLKSRSAAIAEQGEDAEAVDAEQRADNERADKLELRYDSDGRQAKTGPAAEPAPKEVPA